MINPMSRNTRMAPSRRSLKRVPTVLGAERTPMILLILIACVLIFTIALIETTVIGLLILAGGVRGLQAASRVHPRASQVYLRGVKLRRYYPARRRFPIPMPHAKACKLGAREPRVAPRASQAPPESIAPAGDERRREPEPAR